MERSSAIVDTPSGKLQGTLQRSCLGDVYYAFKGVPYAQPPLGQLRFQEPQPVKPWTGIRDASSHGPVSAQYDAGAKKVVGSEDCLYLNVYTQNLDASPRAPVMFWIHGGGFLYGCGNDDQFGPDFLLAKNVVLVTINYRLGIFGFLNLEDKVAPGNQGLKDMVMALKWVKTHIVNFGGDPHNVTIFGGSAGAVCVHFLALSPMANGLFHKAICQSGTALNPVVTQNEPRKSVHQLLDILGCEQRDPKSIVEFLRKTDVVKLIDAQQELLTPRHWLKGTFPFTPGVDDKADKPFLKIPLSEAVKIGVQVPLMIGYNTLDGLLMINSIRALGINNIDENFENYVLEKTSEILRPYNLTLKDLRQFYFKSEKITETNLRRFLELVGDLLFVENTHRVIKIQIHNSGAPTYLYKLSFDKNLTCSLKKLNIEIKGVNHGDELTYLFKSKACDTLNFEQLQQGTGGERVMKQMVELWTNFAKAGRPTLEKSDLLPLYWQPVASDVVLRCLNIDVELRMEKELSIEQRYSYKKNITHLH